MKHLLLVLGLLAVASSISCATPSGSAPNSVAASEGTSSPSAQSSLEITYIANEGVLISSGGKQVLIDGLHREYKRDYAFLPAEHRDKIEQAKSPFDKVDLLLVSHLHLDHFHADSVGLHLKHNPKAMLVSSQQVVGEVEKNFKNYQEIKTRVVGATPQLKGRTAVRVAGIDVDVLGLGHGTGRHGWIQNLGHVVKLGSKKLLHIGDAEASLEIFGQFNLDQEGIDIAIIPYWFLLGSDGQTIIREHIKPKHIIAVHISPLEAEKIAGQIKQAFPDAVAFTTMLEKRHY